MPPLSNTGMRSFLLLWLGHTISLLGAQLTTFGLGVWLFEATQSTTIYGLAMLAGIAPMVLIAPVAGVLVDRLDRRFILLGAELGKALCVAVMALAFSLDALGPALAISCIAASALIGAVQISAIPAVTAQLVAPAQLGRANGLLQLGPALSLLAPLVAGAWLEDYGLISILVADCVAAAIGIVLLALIRVPPPAPGAVPAATSIGQDLLTGWRYVRERRPLLWFLVVTTVLNFGTSMVGVLVTPIVLSFADGRTLGRVISIGGVGAILGSLVMLAWGGPRRKSHAVLGSTLFQGLVLFLAVARPSAALVALGAFLALFARMITAASQEVIWQRKTPPELQGRVLSFAFLVEGASLPLGCALAGPLADRLLHPLMAPNTFLGSTLGPLLGTGTGPSRGAGLLCVLVGLLIAATAIAAFLHRPLRDIDTTLPDRLPPSPASPSPSPSALAEAIHD